MLNRLRAAKIFALICFSSSVSAKSLNAEQITLIRETASNLCNTVIFAKGQKSEAQIAGDIKAQLGGLAGKLADVGLESKGAARREAFEGLSQEATADALHGDRSFRERLFNKMFDVATKDVDRDGSIAEPAQRGDKKSGLIANSVSDAFIGEWVGTVICPTDRNFLITLNIKKQNGDTASGVAQWEGHLRGSTAFRLVPDPLRKEDSSYIYIPSDSSSYAYKFVRLHKDKLAGQSIGSEKCGIIVER